MSQDFPAGLGPARPEVIELGGDGRLTSARPPRLRFAVLGGRRFVPVVAGLGLAAVFASLVGDWAITTFPTEYGLGPAGTRPELRRGVSDIGAFGIVYLLGTFVVMATLALVLRGTVTVRRDARLVGLVIAGGLVGVLAAVTVSFRDGAGFVVLDPSSRERTEYGRGLVMAYAAMGALGLALYLAGRFLPSPADPAAAVHPADAGDVDDPIGVDDRPTPRRRHASAADDEPDEEAPLDLTVAPTTPFVLPDQSDQR